MDERNAESPADGVCERLGDLAATAVPASDLAPDQRQWTAIEGRLTARTSSWRSPSRLLPAFALAAVALVGGGLWLYARRPLAYRVDSCAVAADGALTSTGAGSVAFADGSQVTLASGTRLRVRPLPFAVGAELTLEAGEARLAVVHRASARWAVLAGPFRVEVTGTRFALRWSQQRGRLRVAMQEGSVRITGGPLAGSTLLHAGQALEGSATDVSVVSAEAGPGASETAPAARAPTVSPGPPQTADVQTEVAPASRRHQKGSPARSKPTRLGGSETTRRAPARPDETRTLALPALPALAPSAAPVDTPSPAPVRSAPHWISIDADGRLSEGMTGFAWLAGGAGTTLSSTVVHAEHARLLPKDGELCARGTIAGMRCVNDKLPQMRCNWDKNWGVALGLFVRADRKAWGEEAAAAIAVDFHGRTNRYRLNAHRAGDPKEKVYCIYDYQSGQIARPGMFRSACWDGKGEALSDFKSVDQFTLHLPSGLEYMAFRYCIAGVQVIP